jgi:putative ABC transport system permease protein
MFTLDNIIFTLLGILGVLRKLIPQLILELKKRKYANDKIKLVALSNLYLSIKKLAFLLITLAVSVEVLFTVISVFPLTQVRTVCMLSYITIILLISLSIVYKSLIDANAKKRIFYQLSLTGYTFEQIKNIIKSEFIIYYFIVIVIPLIPILSFMIIFKRLGIISMTIIISMLGIFIVAFLITGIVSFTIYKKISLEKNAYRFF